MSEQTYKSVTIRVPADLYIEYKAALHAVSAIPTYDIRNHMRSVVEKHNLAQSNK